MGSTKLREGFWVFRFGLVTITFLAECRQVHKSVDESAARKEIGSYAVSVWPLSIAGNHRAE
jgi:hypothetical protein